MAPMHPDDMVRELDKIHTALEHAGNHLSKQNEANASLHLSNKVLYSPLTVAVLNAAESATRLREHFAAEASQ